MSVKKNNFGFTLIELLVVIAIIGVLSSTVMASLNTARKKARDAKRLSHMREIIIALELYYDKYGMYPDNTTYSGGTSCDGTDGSTNNFFLNPLVIEGFFSKVPIDPLNSGDCSSGSYVYRYHRYASGGANCATTDPPFYLLAVRNMETSGVPHPNSPGFKCVNGSNVQWMDWADWVTGGRE